MVSSANGNYTVDHSHDAEMREANELASSVAGGSGTRHPLIIVLHPHGIPSSAPTASASSTISSSDQKVASSVPARGANCELLDASATSSDTATSGVPSEIGTSYEAHAGVSVAPPHSDSSSEPSGAIPSLIEADAVTSSEPSDGATSCGAHASISTVPSHSGPSSAPSDATPSHITADADTSSAPSDPNPSRAHASSAPDTCGTAEDVLPAN